MFELSDFCVISLLNYTNLTHAYSQNAITKKLARVNRMIL